VDGFKSQVVDIAERLQAAGYFKSSSDLLPSQRKFLQDLLKRRLPRSDWRQALRRLCEFVSVLTKRKTIVLVDEYDTPMSEALECGYLDEVIGWFVFTRFQN
jgi:Predicted AAA-ATPase.